MGKAASRRALLVLASNIVARFGVKTAGTRAAAKGLSGGNLQKFIVGREIIKHPKVFVVSQPTWGVDVGAAAQILIKSGANTMVANPTVVEIIVRIFTQWRLLLGYSFYGVSTVLLVAALLQ